jgi:hypothetical protein
MTKIKTGIGANNKKLANLLIQGQEGSNKVTG